MIEIALRATAALTLLMLVLSQPAQAEADTGPAEPDSRPRVGLVLGGGGARGAAHIGVLRELERLQVPVDAVVGTSMGAIIGGLYAAGMSTDELETLVLSLDWGEVLSDEPARSDLRFRRKQDDRQFPVDLELGLSDGRLRLPQGVVQGQKLDLLLRELRFDVSRIENFDRLGIPFRAIATDIVTGERHVIDEGDLATAIRASMSVPGVLAPVRLGDRLLVDGGLTGNLGIDVINEMDVDVVIAVDVEFPLYPIEALDSALAISEQVLTVLIRNETQRQISLMAKEDILIRPELGTLGSSEFERSRDAFEPGVAAARAEAGRLEVLALDNDEYAAYRAARQTEPADYSRLAFVRIETDSIVSDRMLGQRLQLEPGSPIDPSSLAADANRLYGLRLFERVGYRLEQAGNGQTGVVFEATEKTWGDSYLKFGLAIENDFEGSTAFNFATRLWRPGVNSLGAEWRTDLQVGTRPRFGTEFYQPLRGGSALFVAPNFDIEQSNIEAFVDNRAVARLRVSEARLGLDGGAELGNWGEFRVGAYHGWSNARVKVGDPQIPNLSNDLGGIFARLLVDSFDDTNFPRSGTRAELLWDLSRPGLGADSEYDVFSLNYNRAFSRGKSTLVAGVDFETSRNADNVVEAYFPVGGFLRLSGLERGQLSGPHAGVVRLVYYRRVGSSAGGLLDLPIYLGASLEAGNAWASRDAIDIDSVIVNGSLFLGLDTFIGPIYLASGFAENGESNFYLFIGALPE